MSFEGGTNTSSFLRWLREESELKLSDLSEKSLRQYIMTHDELRLGQRGIYILYFRQVMF